MQKRPSYSGMLWPNCSGLSFSWVRVVSLYIFHVCMFASFDQTLCCWRLSCNQLWGGQALSSDWSTVFDSYFSISVGLCTLMGTQLSDDLPLWGMHFHSLPLVVFFRCLASMYRLWKNVSVKLCHQCCGYKHWSCYGSDLFKECILISLILSLLSVQTNSKVSATSLKQATSYEEFSLSLCFSAKLGFLCPLCFGSHSLTRVSSHMVSVI
jgi:hypothetical protein